MGSRLYCMRWLVIQANLILMVSKLPTLSSSATICHLHCQCCTPCFCHLCQFHRAPNCKSPNKSSLYVVSSFFRSENISVIVSGVWLGPAGARYLDDERQVFPGGVAEEPALHGHHLHHPHLLHCHDLPLLLWVLCSHEGDQVLPADVKLPHCHYSRL